VTTPDFTKLPYGFPEFPRASLEAWRAAAGKTGPWLSPEGIAHRVAHTAADANVPHSKLRSEEAAARRQTAIDAGKEVIVGRSAFRSAHMTRHGIGRAGSGACLFFAAAVLATACASVPPAAATIPAAAEPDPLPGPTRVERALLAALAADDRHWRRSSGLARPTTSPRSRSGSTPPIRKSAPMPCVRLA